MTEPSDADLVRRCLAGDEAGWVALTERYADLVFAVARRQGLSSDAASDVVQEVFLSLLSNLKKLRNAERLLAWIVRSARQESWRQIRRIRSRRRREEAVARKDDAGGAEPPDDLADLEMRQTVRQAYGALGERCRRLLDGLLLAPTETPYTQLAQDLGLAVGSIGSLRRRCLEELRDELERLGLPEDDLP